MNVTAITTNTHTQLKYKVVPVFRLKGFLKARGPLNIFFKIFFHFQNFES